MTFEDLLTQRRVLRELEGDKDDDWPFRAVGPREPCLACGCFSFKKLSNTRWECRNCGDIVTGGHSAAS